MEKDHDKRGRPMFMLSEEDQRSVGIEKCENMAKQLMGDFIEHKNVVKKADPEMVDSRIFEAWAIQMIANFQVTIEYMYGEIQRLHYVKQNKPQSQL